MKTLKKPAVFLLTFALVLHMAAPLQAGGPLESVDITGNVPGPIAGTVIARVIGIRWDSRCMPLQYKVNNTLNPIPNPLGAAFLSVNDATTVLQDSLDQWNQIPTSFIDMHVAGTTNNASTVRFDFINEVSFRTAANFGAIASSPSTNLITDINLVNGQDIDGDGDPDVSGAIATCMDADGDGDVEFPAGFYRAGTILDNDVQFNTKATNGLRFTITDAALDTVTRSVDLMAVAVHEFGHSIGLSHVLNNQKSATDGGGATMFPFIDTGDPAAEFQQRSLDSDDIAWASFFYPEGTADSGPAALQDGDVAFSSVFGLIQGTVHHGVLNQPIAGASVSAINRDTGEWVATGFSGTTQLARNAAGGLFLVNPAFNILNGNFTIPVPQGNYTVTVEPVDGQPVPATSVSFTTQIGSIFGQFNFNEEFWNLNKEGGTELRPGQNKNVHVNPGKVTGGINIVTNGTVNLNPFGARQFIGFTNSPAGRYYAVRFPAAEVSGTALGTDYLVHSGLFNTIVVDASVPVVFSEAMLTTGTVDAMGNILSLDLVNPLERVAPFVAKDDNFAPLQFKNPHELGRRVARGISRGEVTNLFLVLRIPTETPFAGVSGQAPLVGLSNTNPAPLGRSYVSSDGINWTRPAFNFMFSLVLAPPAN